MAGRVEGKVAFITGAARGQGRSHAVRLAEEGADIIAVDSLTDVPDVTYPQARESDLAETVRLVEALDRRIIATKADVRDPVALTSAVDEGVAEFGRLDIVSANAGVVPAPAEVSDVTERAWQDVIDINLSGVWHTVKATTPHIVAGGRGGSVILTSSSVGLRGARNVASYAASKHAVVGIMRTLALELGKHSIRVNSVHPTQVDTDMIQNEAMYRLFLPHLENPGRDDFAAASMHLNVLPVPWIDPVDVSNALVFLASEEARYITGVTLPVDAGQILTRRR
ncbi:mycofactocin-coupled SDR family oxidoreductase [Jatrophihabitans sp.]|uniref:mycofactocin-coupled SDR family oxidoreductase n=1 Tax=Jatrophihabitans sp. TaxID=1932789 RepID=UPI0030C782FE|nr:short-chain dehydrogenase/reductase [Jatrophihabitans sp.]